MSDVSKETTPEKRAAEILLGILLEGKKNEFQEKHHDEIKQSTEKVKHLHRQEESEKENKKQKVYATRLERPKYDCTPEGAAKLLRCKNILEVYLVKLTKEISQIKPTVEGDFIKGSNRLTARFSLDRMPYLQTNREKKMIQGLKQEWEQSRAEINNQVDSMINSAPREILELDDSEVEIEDFMLTGVLEDHTGIEDKQQSEDYQINDTIEKELEDGYYEPDEEKTVQIDETAREIIFRGEINGEETPKEKAQRHNLHTLSFFYKEWVGAHADLRMIEIAMELCSADTKAYAEQMYFEKGKATKLLAADNDQMSFLKGRECHEEAVTTMHYVIALQEKVKDLHAEQQPKTIDTVFVKDGDEQIEVQLTYELIKKIAADEVALCPAAPWYSYIDSDSDIHSAGDIHSADDNVVSRADDKLVGALMQVDIGQNARHRRGVDDRPLSAIHQYRKCHDDKMIRALMIKDVYTNSRALHNSMLESINRLRDDAFYTIPAEILRKGVVSLLRRVCAFQSVTIHMFEEEMEKLPEKQKMVLQQLYIEGKRFRELKNEEGKAISKNSSNRWNQEGLTRIQEQVLLRLNEE